MALRELDAAVPVGCKTKALLFTNSWDLFGGSGGEPLVGSLARLDGRLSSAMQRSEARTGHSLTHAAATMADWERRYHSKIQI